MNEFRPDAYAIFAYPDARGSPAWRNHAPPSPWFALEREALERERQAENAARSRRLRAQLDMDREWRRLQPYRRLRAYFGRVEQLARDGRIG